MDQVETHGKGVGNNENDSFFSALSHKNIFTQSVKFSTVQHKTWALRGKTEVKSFDYTGNLN